MPHLAPSIANLQQACRALEVYVHGRAVGIIEQAEHQFAFQYYPHAHPQDAVSLLMPVRTFPYYGPGPGLLPPVFDMNLPEGSLRRSLVTRYSKLVTGFNDLALLALVGRNTIGRLTFGNVADQSPRLDLASLMETRDANELLRQLYGSDGVFSGIAGAQPKVIAAIDDDAVAKFSDNRASSQDLRATFRSDSVIVKTSGAEFPWLAANEFHCLRVAQLAGLAVADTRLLEGGMILLVSRFDRRPTSAEHFMPVAAEDVCSLMGHVSSAKYESYYERVLKVLKQFLTPDTVAADAASFFKMLVVNCVLRNGDAHLKNFSVLYDFPPGQDSPEVMLAPTYDVVTTNAYLKQDMLALTLAGSKRYPRREKLTSFARMHALLQPAAIQRIYEEVTSAVHTAARELIAYGEQHPDFHKRVGLAMLTCWQAGLQVIGSDLTLPHSDPPPTIQQPKSTPSRRRP